MVEMRRYAIFSFLQTVLSIGSIALYFGLVGQKYIIREI